ncbi:ATP phosphoribosyltransferase regulatory subunit [Candidatus Thioglobus sp.]|jgi:ATP phosphoribosyltransferase involved in histidine biosynthesis|uniref:ATP phosphoribosyltransferase regulatory subunit n=1 Tax=Candidatus Thioglobus sp. TaxID=2026721 RepID=UPI00324241D6
MGVWQLPEGIDELIGAEAIAFESVRRQLLDLYADKGFGLIIPPMVEYVESLLLTSDSVDQKTFKFLDSVSGKMLGVHADITPQIARIDAKSGSENIAKYCYINAILQTKADDFYASRSPIQAGAELYGSEDVSADIEVIELMLDSLKLLSINSIVLSLGNVAIFNAMIEQESLSNEQISQLKQIFVRRSTPDLNVFLNNNALRSADQFSQLMKLEGDASILDEALEVFKDLPKAKSAVEDLIKINNQLDIANIKVIVDLAELRAYEYHTGVVFSAYNENYSKALAQGGRYNGLSESFGQSRAATGFSFDLKFLSQTK